MSEPIDLICFSCKHFTPIEGGCKAFPEGIPTEVIETNQHSKPLPDQKNDIVFEESDD